ncbi:site-specific integrase [Nocardia abscessus]|uniref:site-specific integrase n=1 Tax=Nocardia abscessus TaxID=120957 RepID=UPI0002FE8F53|nr:site-specific integrase [Nocardia abscessus]MCC3328345.1 site-specific integrase [Nocardia abscessus]
MDIYQQLMQGRATLPRAGLVVPTDRAHPPFVVLDRADVEIVAVTEYLAELALGDSSPLTCRSYAYDLLRWFRFLWVLDVDWTQATQSEVAVMVGWLRTAPNPQRQRHKAESPTPGTVNLRTGKPALAAGYARTTINHALSVTWNLTAAATISLRYDHELRRCVGHSSADGEVAGARPARTGCRLVADMG